MQTVTNPTGPPALARVLGTRDLVLLNIAAIVGLRWLTTAAKIGPSSLILWALGLILFFVPVALAVLELSSRLPGEGGLYLWTKAAFGNRHGFIAGCCGRLPGADRHGTDVLPARSQSAG